MDERQQYIRAHLLSSIRNVSIRVNQLRHQLASAVAEQDRLRNHLEQLEREEARRD